MKRFITAVLSLALVFSCFAVLALTVSAEGEDEIKVVSATFESAVAGECKESLRGGAADNSVLYDGETLADQTITSFDTKGIVLTQNTKCTEAGVHPQYSYILELSEKADITAVKIATYEEYMSMIGLPMDNKVAVEYSDNGTDFTLAGDYTFVGEAVNGEKAANEYTIELGKTITGKFVKLTFAYGDSPFPDKVVWEWHGFTELGVTAVPAAGAVDLSDEGSSASAESSSAAEDSSAATVESSVETSNETSTSTPSTGDAGVIALAIVSVISLAGAVVIKRK